MTSTAPRLIGLWLLDRAAHVDQLSGIETTFACASPDERARAAGIVDHADARLWLAGRTALRLLIAAQCGAATARTAFVRTPYGRPHLPGDPIHFSVSDSGAWLAIALASGHAIGVDIEQPRNLELPPTRIDALNAAARGLAAASAPAGAVPPPLSPLQAWVRLEAFAKAADLTVAAALTRLGARGHARDPRANADISVQAAAAARSAGLGVCDLALPGSLVGALSFCRPLVEQEPEVQLLDAAAIAALGAGIPA